MELSAIFYKTAFSHPSFTAIVAVPGAFVTTLRRPRLTVVGVNFLQIPVGDREFADDPIALANLGFQPGETVGCDPLLLARCQSVGPGGDELLTPAIKRVLADAVPLGQIRSRFITPQQSEYDLCSFLGTLCRMNCHTTLFDRIQICTRSEVRTLAPKASTPKDQTSPDSHSQFSATKSDTIHGVGLA